MKFSASAFQAAVAMHLSPQLGTRVGQLYEEALDRAEANQVDTEACLPGDGQIALTDAADLLALALHGDTLDAAYADLNRLTLTKATVKLDGYGVSTLSPSDVQYEPRLSDWTETTFARALMGPMLAGLSGPCPEGSARPYWGLIDLYSHDGRVLGGNVGLHFGDGTVCLTYGEDPPATRFVIRRSISGDGLAFIGNALREACDTEWPAELLALVATAPETAPDGGKPQILH